MAASDPVWVAQQIAILEHRLGILERTDQLGSSSVTLPGGSIAVGDAVGAAVDASAAASDLADRLASNETAVAAASTLADQAAQAAAEAGDLGLAAGQEALDAADAANAAAETAVSNAADAVAAAQRAQTSADGKSANTYSTSAPPSPDPDSASRADGDSWYVITTTGNLIGIYRWSSASSSWVQGILTGGAVGNLDAGVIVSGYIAAARIAANTITSAMIQADAITAREIAAATITSAEIAAQTILAANIAGNTITAAQIAANTITAAQIKAGTITANEIAANTITAAQIAAGAVTATSLAAGAIDGMTITGATIRTASSGIRTETTSAGLAFYAADNTKVGSLTPGTGTGNSYLTRLGLAAADNPNGATAYEITIGPKASSLAVSNGIALASTMDASFRATWTDAVYANDGTPLAIYDKTNAVWRPYRTNGAFGYASGMSNTSGNTSRLSIQGDEIHWHAAITCASNFAAGYSVGTLPVGFRPADQIVVPGVLVAGASPGIAEVLIDAAGTVRIGGYVSSTTSNQLKFDVHFLNA